MYKNLYHIDILSTVKFLSYFSHYTNKTILIALKYLT